MTEVTLQELVQVMDDDRRCSSEVLRQMPKLITENGDVPFNLFDGQEAVQVPSIPKLQEALSTGGLSQITDRINRQEDLTRGIIQETGRLAAAAGLTRQTAYWSPLDLSDKNEDGNSNDPLYRANVDDGIRFPYDGYIVNQSDRIRDSEGEKIGPYLLPKHGESTDKRWTSVTSQLNVAAYPAFTRTITRTYWNYWRYYYGYYWYWRYYYRYYWSSYTYTYTIPGKPLSGSMAAQTFQVKQSKVLKGFNLNTYKPSSYRGSNPRLLLVETAYGAPLLNKVICEGTFRDDTAMASGSSSIDVHVDLEYPVLLEPNKSYAFVIIANGTWQTTYNANQDNTGGVFYTQDGQFWTSDLAKDLCYTLRFADFGDQTEHVIELQPLSLSGGIASISLKTAAEIATSAELRFEISINDQWRNIDIVSELENLPPYTPIRAVFRGTKDVMPLLNVEQSQITAFRPADELNYISKDRTVDGSGRLKITYELTGYKPDYHQFAPQLKIGSDFIDPVILTHRASSDGFVTTFDATFELDNDIETYQHVIKGSTQTATRLFDITGVIELKG